MAKKVIFYLILIAVASTGCWAARFPSAYHPVHVRPYFKKSGKFVQQYYRARPHQYRPYSL